jgi:hypothetical protein
MVSGSSMISCSSSASIASGVASATASSSISSSTSSSYSIFCLDYFPFNFLGADFLPPFFFNDLLGVFLFFLPFAVVLTG